MPSWGRRPSQAEADEDAPAALERKVAEDEGLGLECLFNPVGLKLRQVVGGGGRHDRGERGNVGVGEQSG